MIALDIETSGVDAELDSILSLGAVDTDDPTNQFYDECRVWDGAHINDESLTINGFSREDITDQNKKSEAELVRDFLAWCMDRPSTRMIVGQNSWFDRNFLKAACKRAGIEYPLADRLLDIHTLAWLHMTLRGETPPTKNQRSALDTTTILAYCGLPPEPKPHNALTGAFIHAEIFSRIAYTKKTMPEFEQYEIPFAENV